jgi:hypothetical protein
LIIRYIADSEQRTFTKVEKNAVVAVMNDYEVNIIRLLFPLGSEDTIDLTSAVKVINYQHPDGPTVYRAVVSSVEAEEEYSSYMAVDWILPDALCKKTGNVNFSFMAYTLNENNYVDQKWHSLITSFQVQNTLEGEEPEIDEEDQATYAMMIEAMQATVFKLQTQIERLAGGGPTAVTSSTDFVDHSLIYIYKGEEEDYLPGYWYYYDESQESWEPGGAYGYSVPDSVLDTTSDNPVQNKVIATAFNNLRTEVIQLAHDAVENLPAGSIARAQLAAAVEAVLQLAETAMQPSVYDTLGIRTDIYQYAKGRADYVYDNYVKPLADDVHGAYTFDDDGDTMTYTSLAASLQGVLNAAKAYVRARLVEYKAFTITVVDELPVAGEPMVFYLVPKDGEAGYNKYWWITDESGTSKWDVFGSSSTKIVTILPGTGDPDVDYILKTSSGCLYYKWIDGEWCMVAGSLALTVQELPETGDEYTDYYCPNAAGTYVHYRWIGGQWETIGSDSYTKAEVNNLIQGITNNLNSLTSDLGTTNSNLSSLSRTVDRLAQDLSNIDTEGLTYEATLTQDGGTYVFTLYEYDGDEATIKSQFVLPSGGGGGGSSGTTQLEVEKVTPSPVVCTPTDKVEIQINYSSTDTDGELVDGTYTWRIGTTTIAAGALVQGLNTFDLTEHCSVGTQKLMLTVTDEGGSVAVKSWTVQIVDVRLESAFSDRYTNPLGRSVNFTYTPYGAISKTVHFKLDGVELESVSTMASGTLQSYTLAPQAHGAHLLECWMTATVNNTNIETTHIFKDIIWYDEESSLPVIGCAYRFDHYGQVTARQYDTTRITYVVYDPSTSTPAVTLAVDGTVVNNLTLMDALNTWAYKSDDVAVHVLTITCRSVSVEIRVNVHELGYDVSPVTANLEFDFDPIGRSNTSANHMWQDDNHPEVAMTVSPNFDWANGGYKLDEDGNAYFCIKAGSRAYISYNLFGSDPLQAGAEFKVIFKTSNVRDNTTSFLTCIPEDAVPVGLDMKAHAAYLKTSTNELYMPYSEEDVIEYEYNVNPLDLENAEATSYIMTYEDGVGARPLIYDASHRIYQYTPVPITIGSDDCDVWIYRMKAYSSALSDTDILKNFIADSRDSSTMIDRYERNQIYDENSQLTPESVANACPNLRIIKIDCPHFTNDKKDYVRGTNVQCIYRNGDSAYDNWQWFNGYHAGQGTTSNEYGFAGRNIDLIFGFDGIHQRVSKIPLDASYISELVLGDGTRYTDGTGKVSLTRQSVPNDWFNVKVNIASSENANNALLQKRYNDFIPYKTPGQKEDPRRKNSMEFQNCVIFVRENDPDLSTHREFPDTGWHFYGIGNIGDSKKTDNTRVTDPTDLAEFVVEVSDNTLPNSWFQTGVYMTEDNRVTFDPDLGVEVVYPITRAQWEDSRNLKRKSLYEAWDDSFEFRYDMGTKDGETITSDEIEAQQELSKQVWRDMYEWVITSTDAEFVSQFSNWFITSSPLYWYLFTERYTMIDNRAKNSFWHWGKTYITEAEAAEMGDRAQYYTIDNAAAAINNGYRFDLWDYDNDTALGINNSGELTMTYGKEDIDYKTDGDPSSGFIYNAAQSIFWRRIRGLMHSQLQALYLDRESAGCWSAESLIAQWDSWQEQFPEELWRLDIERKYLRTYQAGTVRFLNEMMNGRKKYQRRQFERDQEAYIGTKYVGTGVRADQIMFRCNTPSSAVVAPDYTLRLVPYSDMYLTVLYGNSPAPVQVRAKAGVEYILETQLTEMDDTAILIYCASRIQAINNLSALYIHDNDFSKASKLKTLVIGNTTAGYSNPFLTSLNMGNNTLLETLDIRNCPNLTGSINLSACENLVNLFAEGTAITSVLFAANGKIVHAHLPATINSLTFRQIQYLTDLILASYDNLEAFICEYSALDAMTIVQTALSSLQICRVLGIDWEVADTSLLNSILAMSQSLLTGQVYISGPIRNQELLSYAAAWPDLDVTYDSSKLVTQYLVTWVNANGDTLYSAYVDRGTVPTDPVTAGLITTPVMASDAQYDYTFSGWDDPEGTVLSAKTITAQYTQTVRRYTVRWLSRVGLVLETQTCEYGSEAVYSGDLPTNTEEEGSYIYNLFAGWDKSTGYITGNTDVFAIWERAELPAVGTDMSNMSRAEIFGVHTAGMASTYFEDKDHFDMSMGSDFTFTNVESREIMRDRFFDGSTYYDTGIKLFNSDAASFTLAIEFEFLDTNSSGGTLVSAYEETGNEGFRLRYSTHPNIQWGDKDVKVGSTDNRHIIVLRHQKGSNHLYVYASDMTANTYDLELTTAELVRTRATEFEGVLSFGAVRFAADGGHDYYGKGWIHWCKIWYADLGDAVARKLAAWIHEPVRMEFVGADRYRLAGTTSVKANGSYLANNILTKLRQMNPSNTNVGGWDESIMREFLNTRVWEGLDYGWQSAIKQVKIFASAGNRSTEIVTSEDRIYLAATREIGGSSESPYGFEGDAISFYTSQMRRLKFTGHIWDENAQVITAAQDPTQLTSYTVREGDIWIHTGNQNIGYMYLSAATIAKHTTIGCRKVSAGENIEASDGGLWLRAISWWLRSPHVGNTTFFWSVYNGGTVYTNGASNGSGLALGFSI